MTPEIAGYIAWALVGALFFGIVVPDEALGDLRDFYRVFSERQDG